MKYSGITFKPKPGVAPVQHQRNTTQPAGLMPVAKPLRPGIFSQAAGLVKRYVMKLPDGPELWATLHLHALQHQGGDDSEWLANFEKGLLSGCSCRSQWLADVSAHPPDFTRYFEWTVEQHNLVNKRLGKPVLTVEQALAIWSQPATAKA